MIPFIGISEKKKKMNTARKQIGGCLGLEVKDKNNHKWMFLEWWKTFPDNIMVIILNSVNS